MLKSIAELDALVEDVLLKDDYDRAHLENFSTAQENKRLDEADSGTGTADGWTRASIKIKLPAPGVCVPEGDAPEFEVEGLVFRPLLDVMLEVFQGPAFERYHITPFEYRWDPHHTPDSPDLPSGHQTVYGEIYMSPKMLKLHIELPKPATPNLDTIIAAYMFFSDSTHLDNFGNVSLRPLYTFFDNQSKYEHARPTANTDHHHTRGKSRSMRIHIRRKYLPDSIKDLYREIFGIAPSADMLAHLKCGLMHAIWDLLLSPEFIHAYVHGIVVKCYDGVEHLIFPRFFIYGADYLEKILLATIKYFGGCPCPRCLITKDQISDMGTKNDMGRRKKIREDTAGYRNIIARVRGWIFDKGALVAGAAVSRCLKPKSWVPTRFWNTFSKLAEFSFNFFEMFVPDLLHEVELSGWKSLFTHLVRVQPHLRGKTR
ncbi:hypothetical protein C8R46DRAFT_903252 [Mycena filopes]|nr:hypothetical protein C8R46DRAFT_903252 [Mycena filopes]